MFLQIFSLILGFVYRYSLYLAVMNSIDGYFETPWVEIDIEAIIAQLAEFDVRYKY